MNRPHVRGRGVRTRGGRAGPSRPPPMEEVHGNKRRTVDRIPSTVDNVIIYDIEDYPKGHALETALHPKRMRTWTPSSPAPEPPSSPSPPPEMKPPSPKKSRPLPAFDSESSASPPPPARETESSPSPPPRDILSSPSPPRDIEPHLSPLRYTTPSPPCDIEPSPPRDKNLSPKIKREPPSPRSSITPSPKKFVKPPSSRSPLKLRVGNRNYLLNYGSEPESDDSDNEDDIVPPRIPKAIRCMMETPLDLDTGHKNAACDPLDTASVDGAEIPPMTTEQPWGLYQFDWRVFPDPPIPPESRRETFTVSDVGPTIPRTDPYAIFTEIWDRQIMEEIVLETNKYAQQVTSQMLRNNDLRPRSRISKWRDTTVDELYVYMAIVLAMGVVVKSRIEEYWGSTPDIFYTPGFSALMSIDRFLILSKCLHFNDNEKMSALDLDYSEARVFKILPLILHLNKKFQAMYTPAQNISLDESLLQWERCLEFSQIIPKKVARRGIKTYEICESQTGYLWRFEVHTHKKSPPQQLENPLDAFTPSIVLKLIEGLEHKGYTLWMDNFYHSPCLARRLKSLGVDCVGTLRTDRKFVPPVLRNLTKLNMSQGQIAGLTSGDVDVMVWRDSNRVAMISTYHGSAQQTARGATKPILILDYNNMMGGVDKKDQLLTMYPIERKRTRVWYKKFFERLLNVTVLNSFIIHRNSHHVSLTHRNFRMKLIRSLLSQHSNGPTGRMPAVPAKKVDVSHRLGQFPWGAKQRMRRACAICKKLIGTYCVACNKAACIDLCFLTLHS